MPILPRVDPLTTGGYQLTNSKGEKLILSNDEAGIIQRDLSTAIKARR